MPDTFTIFEGTSEIQRMIIGRAVTDLDVRESPPGDTPRRAARPYAERRMAAARAPGQADGWRLAAAAVGRPARRRYLPEAACLHSLHVTAVSRLARTALPAMLKRRSGAIITIASALAYSGSILPEPLPFRAMYAGTKAFQLAFTEALAGELAGTGGRALACCPGLIDTGFHQVVGIDVAGIPFPVMPPAEVARAALAGLRLGEVVCVPGLGDQSMVGNVNDAQRALFTTAVSSGLARRDQAS